MPLKKPKQTRWQFGIRSRNPPLDAMYCIYRALQRLGAEWEDQAKVRRSRQGSVNEGDEGTNSPDRGGKSNTAGKSKSDSRQSKGKGKGKEPATSSSKGQTGGQESSDVDDDDYMPVDPWLIRCRWLTETKQNPGTQPGSGRSSTANLMAVGGERGSSARTSPTGLEHRGMPEGSTTNKSQQTNKVYVYMEIQLYQIEPDFYLVDFKCAGYERLLYEEVDADDPNPEDDEDLGSRMGSLDLRTPEGNAAGVRHLRKIEQKVQRMRRVGRRLGGPDEKVSSPFPFLDLASKLIIALAEGD